MTAAAWMRTSVHPQAGLAEMEAHEWAAVYGGVQHAVAAACPQAVRATDPLYTALAPSQA